MLDFFSAIWSVVSSLFNWVTNIVSSFIRFLDLMAKGIPTVIYLSGFMHSFITTAVLVVLSLAIVKVIVGR